jgi:hypothetical protein
MIKYINTTVTSKDELFEQIKSMKGSLKDEHIKENIIEPIYSKYSECLYKITTDSCIAYRPIDSDFWIENPKNNIIYVESHTTPKNLILQEVSKTKGISLATQIVNKWYEDYSSFLFDTSICDVLYMLDRYRGAWSINMPNVMKYKM